jgi:hypothetical protein
MPTLPVDSVGGGRARRDACGTQDRIGLQAGLGEGLEQQVIYLGGVYIAKVTPFPPSPRPIF